VEKLPSPLIATAWPLTFRLTADWPSVTRPARTTLVSSVTVPRGGVVISMTGGVVSLESPPWPLVMVPVQAATRGTRRASRVIGGRRLQATFHGALRNRVRA